jgi:HSP20 family molecular chaperone IbpA
VKNKIVIPKEILATIDFNNSIFGGSVEPNIKINEGVDAFELDIKVPSLSANNLKVDIVDNRLWLYSLQAVLSNTDKNGFMPKTITSFVLPENIDRENISAKYESNGWKIVLPIDSERKGFRKQIDVKF